MTTTYELVKDFKRRYPSTVNWWRTKQHANLVDKNLHPNEEVLYAFAAQWDDNYASLLNTAVMAITTERLIISQDRLIVGYKLTSITPDLFNDVTIDAGLFWGTVKIDTVKEVVYFSNISKKALSEVQTTISSTMVRLKKHYYKKHNGNS